MDTFVTRFFSPMVFVSLFVCTTYVISSASFLITILANENFKTLDEFLRISFFHLKCKESVSEETLMQFYRECSFYIRFTLQHNLSTELLCKSLRDRKPQTIPLNPSVSGILHCKQSLKYIPCKFFLYPFSFINHINSKRKIIRRIVLP